MGDPSFGCYDWGLASRQVYALGRQRCNSFKATALSAAIPSRRHPGSRVAGGDLPTPVEAGADRAGSGLDHQ